MKRGKERRERGKRQHSLPVYGFPFVHSQTRHSVLSLVVSWNIYAKICKMLPPDGVLKSSVVFLQLDWSIATSHVSCHVADGTCERDCWEGV